MEYSGAGVGSEGVFIWHTVFISEMYEFDLFR